MLPALAAMEAAYARPRHPDGRDTAAGGRPMVGYVGADVPVELLTAAGLHAVRLTGDPRGDSALGDRYLGRGVDPMARSILTRLLTGAFGELERVVVSHDCEASLRLFYALRELRRVEPGAGVPEAYLVDILHLPHRTTARYNRRRIAEFAARLRAWTGRPLGLAAAIEAHDERRRLLAAVAGLRRAVPARLTGRQFLAVANAALALDEHIARLRELLAQAGRLPELHGRRVFLSGSDHDTPHVYEAIEADGHVIVGEDHSFGDPQAERHVGTGDLDALAEHYHEFGPTAHRATAAERAAHAAMGVRRCGADLFVAYARTGDDAPAWDFAAQRAALDIPAVLLDRQPYGHADLAALHKEDA
ncbi:2-hydroxyacyl-CoA dehydratase family protein [Nonomuraea rubra]|uniref:Benzoyl-CoA reductase/2-hydroxyglutaryl-CoA dehydratase subunit BcrC/BadD/HgdB n=1 Tax=Nonomuraea rubra TaxID=46180 RepID=A0A7X0NTS7_9ACTN|nr:2-hydroxyacyl-CoA dehydratase family protein [Nonomuraea rubra]MBB6549498.1 benzoyl-CoA reductase/2-hydroxyglutaryl-CoA dehydratase subunit BcrC/BadD/HgdB [Nonomuraea rubra]